jgi:hypothetical protein
LGNSLSSFLMPSLFSSFDSLEMSGKVFPTIWIWIQVFCV